MPSERDDDLASPRDDATAEAELQRRLRRDLNRYLRIRERSRYEVQLYLTRRGYPAALRAAALDDLEAERLIDDRRFAEMFVRDRQRLRPMSARMVLRELRARGVSEQTARDALAACEPPWEDAQMADALLSGRWTRWSAEQRGRRAAQLLRRRGFSSEQIRAAIERRAEPPPVGRTRREGAPEAGEDWR
ncbi:MAG: hypothetical protein GF330_00150 [Candidatus Eisenbacteria bacterium]|nr:hypothetical protein [Candidatus Eisenbacteria bacterium]